MLREFFSYLISLAAIALVVLLLAPIADRVNPTTVALTLLLTVLFVAILLGSRRALAASILAALCFNFFFLPPFFTFHIAETENWIAFAAFAITAVVTGHLSTYARTRADESERRRLQIEGLYRELQDAFEQASEAEALRRSEKLKSSLLDAITHDLRTPLTSIKASATTLLESKSTKLLDDEGEIEFLQIIDEESDRLNQFIEGMVGLAQIEARSMDVRKSRTTVQELVNTATVRARNMLDAHRLSVEIDDDLPLVFLDAHSVSEALYLLLDNAAKYSPKRSEIKIAAVRSRDDSVEIRIDDQGRGIPEQYREKVFQKFVRVPDHDIPSTSDGLGLGLAIVKGIIESQGGKIRIDDAPPGYVTRFTVVLPAETEAKLI